MISSKALLRGKSGNRSDEHGHDAIANCLDHRTLRLMDDRCSNKNEETKPPRYR
jgi:hypothetical protein